MNRVALENKKKEAEHRAYPGATQIRKGVGDKWKSIVFLFVTDPFFIFCRIFKR